MTTQEIILWAVGLIVAVIFGILGLRSNRSRKSQVQKTSANGFSIQSGRDTRIGDDK
jgi:cytochrome c-type biogenesis protein CcmH/NrfF